MTVLIVLLVVLALVFGGFGLAIEGLRLLFWVGVVLLVFGVGLRLLDHGHRH